MKAQIITIGDELLIGQTIDTNSAWIGAEMSRLGFDVWRKLSVHDKREDILESLKESSGKSDVILITGGLGPTSDDITKQTLCEFFNTRLIVNYEVLSMIEEMMRRRNFTMNENNRRQAEVPESCRVLRNGAGTAPGMWFEKEGIIFISMPGVPHEMKYIMTEHVLPELRKRFTSQVIIHRNIMTYGAPEARLAELLKGFEVSLPEETKLAYLPAAGIIKLRLTATGSDRKFLNGLINEQVSNLYKTIPDLIYAENEESFEIVIGKLLKEKGKTISTCESCTGGRIAEMITSVPGSSKYFKGSVIAYDNSVKTELLGVPQNLIDKYGAVSEQVVIKMAEGVRRLLKTDIAVATSGIAGPDGGTDSKPVGTIWISVISEKGTTSEKLVFGSDRITNINRFSVAALNLVRKQILSE
ncbi:MAG: competence/damage-inducible protein A [Bacteroidales bacterium]|jgi:nicotinamide-nucleotide amidase|nr:competence/damage-inducible protein A [Bacteroidales bacterium]